MTGLPRPQVRPLPPDPDAFDAVLARSRTRRHRRVATTCAAAVTGLALVGGGVGASGAATAFFKLADPSPASTTQEQRPRITPTASPGPQPTPTPTQIPSQAASSSQTGSSVPPPRHRVAPSTVLRGLVVDGSGAPVEGAYVYRLHSIGGTLHLRDAPTRTDARGHYQLGCASGPVVIAPWRLVERLPVAQLADRGWAIRYVHGESPPPCGPKRVRTVVGAGSTITGTFTYPDACPHQFTGLLRVRVLGEVDISVGLGPLEPGTQFRIPGLPRGDHVLRSGPTEVPFTIDERGTTLTVDLHADLCRKGDISSPYELENGTRATTPPPSGAATPDPGASGSATNDGSAGGSVESGE